MRAGAARAGGRGSRFGAGRRGAGAVVAGGARAEERVADGDGGRAGAGRGRYAVLPARTLDDHPTQSH
jgi:hypothetical protein